MRSAPCGPATTWTPAQQADRASTVRGQPRPWHYGCDADACPIREAGTAEGTLAECERSGCDQDGAWRTTLRGRQVLADPRINKGTAFSDAERADLGLIGLIPAGHLTLDQQADRVYAQFQRQSSNLARNVLLNELHDRNEVLYYRVLADHLSEMLPVIYTPTVGQAIENYSHEYRRPRGVYLSVDQPELIEQSLRGLRPRQRRRGPDRRHRRRARSWASATGASAA